MHGTANPTGRMRREASGRMGKRSGAARGFSVVAWGAGGMLPPQLLDCLPHMVDLGLQLRDSFHLDIELLMDVLDLSFHHGEHLHAQVFNRCGVPWWS